MYQLLGLVLGETRTFAIAVVIAIVSSAAAQQFTGLGFLPNGDAFSIATSVSNDGNVVVGFASTVSLAETPFRWTPLEGMQALELSQSGRAVSVSGDGVVVVGGFASFGAFRWVPGGYVLLPDLRPGDLASVSGLSRNGAIICGQTSYYLRPRSIRWLSDLTIQELGHLGGEIPSSYARGASHDGEVIVGNSDSPLGYQAFRWTLATGMVGLGDLTGGPFASEATAASNDGSIIVGWGTSSVAREACLWRNGIPESLGRLAGETESEATAVSGPGSLIVGRSRIAGTWRPFLWDQTNGKRLLQDFLTGQGVDLTGWILNSARAISQDGRWVVGEGSTPFGTEAYRAQISTPCPPIIGDLDRDGDVDVQDLAFLLANFGQACA